MIKNVQQALLKAMLLDGGRSFSERKVSASGMSLGIGLEMIIP